MMKADRPASVIWHRYVDLIIGLRPTGNTMRNIGGVTQTWVKEVWSGLARMEFLLFDPLTEHTRSRETALAIDLRMVGPPSGSGMQMEVSLPLMKCIPRSMFLSIKVPYRTWTGTGYQNQTRLLRGYMRLDIETPYASNGHVIQTASRPEINMQVAPS